MTPKTPLDRPCGFADCSGTVWSGSYCMTHYAHKRQYGEMRPINRISLSGQCTESDCSAPHKARGLCRNHYANAKYRGDFPRRLCGLSECEKPAAKRGLCATHYAQARRRGDFDGPKCQVGSCEVFAARAGRCDRHAKRMGKYGLSDDEMDRIDAGVPCEICGIPSEVVDHCHTTGLVRGYLCRQCNSAIGLLRDNPALATAAASYLTEKAMA